jgi:hypothetical protein
MTSAPGKPNLPSILAKPTLDTRYHIDYDWWQHNTDEKLRPYLISHLPPNVRDRLNAHAAAEDRQVDHIDPETGEVSRLDELGLALRQAAELPDFLEGVSMVDAVFRFFLRNGNQAASVRDIAEHIQADPKRLLDLLKNKVYKGIRPYTES